MIKLIDSTWIERNILDLFRSISSHHWNEMGGEKKKKNTIGGNVTEFKTSSHVFHSLYQSYFALAHPPLGKVTH